MGIVFELDDAQRDAARSRSIKELEELLDERRSCRRYTRRVAKLRR